MQRRSCSHERSQGKERQEERKTGRKEDREARDKTVSSSYKTTGERASCLEIFVPTSASETVCAATVWS